MYKRPVGTIYLLKRAELAVRSCMEVALAEFDLTPAQFLMLYRMREQGDWSAAALAREIGVRPQSLVTLIAPLERRGILEREPSPDHGRILHNRLTASGKKLLANALRVAGQIEGELLVNVDDKKLSLLQEVLVELWERAEGHERHPGAIRAKADEMVRAQLPLRRRGSRQGALRAAPRRVREIDSE
jgi:DNA-binding MarR family transcriptional regulator